MSELALADYVVGLVARKVSLKVSNISHSVRYGCGCMCNLIGRAPRDHIPGLNGIIPKPSREYLTVVRVEIGANRIFRAAITIVLQKST